MTIFKCRLSIPRVLWIPMHVFLFSSSISVCLILVLYYVGFITSNTMSLLTERNMVRGGGGMLRIGGSWFVYCPFEQIYVY